MRRLLMWLAIGSVAAVAAAAPASAKHRGVLCVLNTHLSAKNETTGSTSAATGHVQIKVWNDGTISFKAHVMNPKSETFVASHIHQAPAGVAGAIVVPLFAGPATSQTHIKLSGVATPNVGATGAATCQNPSAYYVNFHTTAFAAGAIRGQLG